MSPTTSSLQQQRPARVRQSSFGDDEELANELPATWTLQRFQAQASALLKEYFVARVLEDTITSVRELLTDCPGEADEFGVIAIRSAIDLKQAEQQMVVDLFCGLHRSSALEHAALVRTFEKLFCTWEDIAIDAPKAPEAILGILIGCVQGGVVQRTLLTKLPEDLMNTGLQRAGDSLGSGQEVLMSVSAELREFKKQASKIIEEFFVDCSFEEAEIRLKELGSKPYKHEFVKKVIMMSFSQSDVSAARETVLSLFHQLTTSGTLSKDDLQWGVTRLLGALDDLELDCPHAKDMAMKFIACLVGDEFVSVPFLRRCRLLRIGGPTGLRVIDEAQRRTPEYTKKHLGTTQFKRELHTMILEYFNSGDTMEFGRCVSDLAPLTVERSSELVRKVMSFAMERSGAECEKALKLLISLARNEELDEDSIELGFDDLYTHMPDLLLDVPDALEMARSFVVEAKKAHVLRDDWECAGSR